MTHENFTYLRLNSDIVHALFSEFSQKTEELLDCDSFYSDEVYQAFERETHHRYSYSSLKYMEGGSDEECELYRKRMLLARENFENILRKKFAWEMQTIGV